LTVNNELGYRCKEKATAYLMIIATLDWKAHRKTTKFLR